MWTKITAEIEIIKKKFKSELKKLLSINILIFLKIYKKVF